MASRPIHRVWVCRPEVEIAWNHDTVPWTRERRTGGGESDKCCLARQGKRWDSAMICDSAMLDWEVKEEKKKDPPDLVEPVLSARPYLCSRQLCWPDCNWWFDCACCRSGFGRGVGEAEE